MSIKCFVSNFDFGDLQTGPLLPPPPPQFRAWPGCSKHCVLHCTACNAAQLLCVLILFVQHTLLQNCFYQCTTVSSDKIDLSIHSIPKSYQINKVPHYIHTVQSCYSLPSPNNLHTQMYIHISPLLHVSAPDHHLQDATPIFIIIQYVLHIGVAS